MKPQLNRLPEPITLNEGPNLNPSDAFCIHSVTEHLVTSLKNGTALTAEMMRFAMEDAFGASDTDSAWIWKDAYEAAEVAQIMMLNNYGATM